MDLNIQKLNKSFNITITNLASDKSISHRCAMFSLLSDKPSVIKNFLRAEDTINSLNIAKKLGAVIKDDKDIITITPPKKLSEPDDILDCGNAGTGMRLYCGLLAGVEGSFILTGDKYLRNRPMKRITKPLNSIGARIDGRDNGNLAPLHIRGGRLKAFKYSSKIASAQVKSALILAALNSDGVCEISEPFLSRDHTERMLKGMGAGIKVSNDKDIKISINKLSKPLNPLNITVPADPSSGFFFAVAASIIPNSRVLLKNVTLNKTRIEAYEVLKQMGAKVTYHLTQDIYEPIGDIEVEYNKLEGIEVSKNIPWLIDELPALPIAMAVANGVSVVKNAKELRVKESDRIKSVVSNLKLCGIKVKEFEDGYEIIGSKIKEATINSFGDHRIAMSFAIAGLLSGMKIKDTNCINTSFPNFNTILKEIYGD
jgi:3-phosphoshikimate 1-carboxyvinyltransferase